MFRVQSQHDKVHKVFLHEPQASNPRPGTLRRKHEVKGIRAQRVSVFGIYCFGFRVRGFGVCSACSVVRPVRHESVILGFRV